VAQFKCEDFPPAVRFVLDNPEQWPLRTVLNSFTRNAWKHAGLISAKPRRWEQRIWCERVGSSVMNIWTCEFSRPSGSRTAWTWIKIDKVVTRLNTVCSFPFVAIQVISCHDWWPRT
jgi:hypothetical protein